MIHTLYHPLHKTNYSLSKIGAYERAKDAAWLQYQAASLFEARMIHYHGYKTSISIRAGVITHKRYHIWRIAELKFLSACGRLSLG